MTQPEPRPPTSDLRAQVELLRNQMNSLGIIGPNIGHAEQGMWPDGNTQTGVSGGQSGVAEAATATASGVPGGTAPHRPRRERDDPRRSLTTVSSTSSHSSGCPNGIDASSGSRMSHDFPSVRSWIGDTINVDFTWRRVADTAADTTGDWGRTRA